jgi:RsiW-degrading membrane proteinase PrsW (M82 family)
VNHLGRRPRSQRLLYRLDGEPRLIVPALAILVVTILVSFGIVRLAQRTPSEEDRAGALSQHGRYAAAEAIYARLVHEHATVPLVLAFLENHERGAVDQAHRRTQRDVIPKSDEPVMTSEALEEVLATLPADVALVARFVSEDGEVPTDVRDAIVAGAKREPPAPWYNEILARDALQSHDVARAATYFEREGLAFVERSADVDVALELWMSADEWDLVRRRMSDARVVAAADPQTKARFALHERDWWGAAKWLVLGSRTRVAPWSLAMTGTAAFAWGFFCCRLGRLGERPTRKLLFYVVAFVLGVLSIVPTVALITIEETKLRLVETGDPARDILYFVFGVGLREEASKLLLFSALLPLLRKWGERIDVIVCGAMVGLGFAAEENLGYLASGDLHTGLGRFLTANFLHMAMTAILATALDDFVADGERYASDFTRATLTVVGLHGAYDFLLSHEEYGGTFMAMAVFVFLTRLFLGTLERVRRRADLGLSPLHAFVFAVAVLTGVAAVRASVAVGPLHAAVVMSEGLLGEGIILLVLARSLRAL